MSSKKRRSTPNPQTPNNIMNLHSFNFKQNQYCKKFGCGKVLTHTEKLFSDYCQNHNK